MINFSNPDLITGVIVAIVLAVIYLIGHYHGKTKAAAPAKAIPVAVPDAKTVIVPPVAHPELVQAIAAVKAMADKIHEHLFKPSVPTMEPPSSEPPKAA